MLISNATPIAIVCVFLFFIFYFYFFIFFLSPFFMEGLLHYIALFGSS